MRNINLFAVGLVIGLSLGCGATDVEAPGEAEENTDLAVSEAERFSSADPEYLDFLEQFEAEHGPTRVLGWREEVPRNDFLDLPSDLAAMRESTSDKTVTPLSWGYAHRGVEVRQTTGQSPQAHCVTFGKTCDNEIHSQLVDTFIDGYVDETGELLSRCGRFDSTVDAAWKPCVVPYGNKNPGKKVWTWRFASNTCPNNAYANARYRQGIIAALSDLAGFSDLDFTETTGNDWEILFNCDETLPSGSMAAGFPYGELKLQHAAITANLDECEDAQNVIPPTDGLGHEIYHFGDMYYTYEKMIVSIKPTDFWQTVNGCTSTIGGHNAAAQSTIYHELGHAFGFTHQYWLDTRPSHEGHTELMSPYTTCANTVNTAIRFHPFMLAAINDADIPRPTEPLQIIEEDISCLLSE